MMLAVILAAFCASVIVRLRSRDSASYLVVRRLINFMEYALRLAKCAPSRKATALL